MQIPVGSLATCAAAGLALCLAGCESAVPTAAPGSSSCGSDGRLVAELYGSVRASIDWDRETLECEGMPRPNGEGARLRFAGPAIDAGERLRLAFILALPDLVRGRTGKELPTSVTLIEEGSGEFFSTRGAVNCWTDIDTHERMQADEPARYRISGLLYCVSPLANLNDNSSVSFTDLRFAGLLDWQPPE